MPSVLVNELAIDPRQMALREPGFGLPDPDACHSVQVSLPLDAWLAQFQPLYDSFLKDTREESDPELRWLSELGYPSLEKLLREHPERLSALVIEYFLPEVLVPFFPAEASPGYLLNQIDEIRFQPQEVLFIGKAILTGKPGFLKQAES